MYKLVFQTYGQSFMQPDIDVFKQNLLSLQQLNTKWKLYQKVWKTNVIYDVNQFEYIEASI